MSFSIPSKTVQEIASDLMRFGYVKGRVRMGFSGMEITQEDIYYYDVPSGIVILEIADDSPLKKTDIKENDIITAVDGIEITSFQDVYDILSDHKAGDKITLTIYRETRD
jgi:serine protease Do